MYLTCVSSKLCEFILSRANFFFFLELARVGGPKNSQKYLFLELSYSVRKLVQKHWEDLSHQVIVETSK